MLNIVMDTHIRTMSLKGNSIIHGHLNVMKHLWPLKRSVGRMCFASMTMIFDPCYSLSAKCYDLFRFKASLPRSGSLRLGKATRIEKELEVRVRNGN